MKAPLLCLVAALLLSPAALAEPGDAPAASAPASPAPQVSANAAVPEKEEPPLAGLQLGMTGEEIRALGATPTDVPGMFQLSLKQDEEWTGVAQLEDGRVVALFLFTHMDEALPDKLFSGLRDRGYLPAANASDIRPPAPGEDEGASREALAKRAFSADGEATVLFFPMEFFAELAGAAGNPDREQAVFTAHAADRVYAVTIDRAASQISCAVASWGYLSQEGKNGEERPSGGDVPPPSSP